MNQQILTTFTQDELKQIITDAIREQQPHTTNVLSDQNLTKLLTIKEVCNIFNVTRQTINYWNKSGKLIYYKIGSRVYYKYDEVMQALRKFDFSNWQKMMQNL